MINWRLTIWIAILLTSLGFLTPESEAVYWLFSQLVSGLIFILWCPDLCEADFVPYPFSDVDQGSESPKALQDAVCLALFRGVDMTLHSGMKAWINLRECGWRRKDVLYWPTRVSGEFQFCSILIYHFATIKLSSWNELCFLDSDVLFYREQGWFTVQG